eukprot:1196071-Prorocentrum_minimum.AAC.7
MSHLKRKGAIIRTLLNDVLEELARAAPPRVGAHGLVGVLVLAEEEVLLPAGARRDARALHVLLQQRLERIAVLALLPLPRRLLLLRTREQTRSELGQIRPYLHLNEKPESELLLLLDFSRLFATASARRTSSRGRSANTSRQSRGRDKGGGPVFSRSSDTERNIPDSGANRVGRGGIFPTLGPIASAEGESSRLGGRSDAHLLLLGVLPLEVAGVVGEHLEAVARLARIGCSEKRRLGGSRTPSVGAAPRPPRKGAELGSGARERSSEGVSTFTPVRLLLFDVSSLRAPTDDSETLPPVHGQTDGWATVTPSGLVEQLLLPAPKPGRASLALSGPAELAAQVRRYFSRASDSGDSLGFKITRRMSCRYSSDRRRCPPGPQGSGFAPT